MMDPAVSQIQELLKKTDEIAALHRTFTGQLEEYLLHGRTQRILGEVVAGGLPDPVTARLEAYLRREEDAAALFAQARETILRWKARYTPAGDACPE